MMTWVEIVVGETCWVEVVDHEVVCVCRRHSLRCL